jgi:hypothetical protein
VARLYQRQRGERDGGGAEASLTWDINWGTAKVASTEERSSQCKGQTRNEEKQVTHLIYYGSTVTRDLPQVLSFLGFDSCHAVTLCHFIICPHVHIPLTRMFSSPRTLVISKYSQAKNNLKFVTINPPHQTFVPYDPGQAADRPHQMTGYLIAFRVG